MGIIFEVCCGSYEDALTAKQAGAHRVELNSALFLGGLTPSMGNFLPTRKLEDLEVLPMVRPRPGGFFYSPAEYSAMVLDARLFMKHGADGIVFGFLLADGNVDEQRTAEFAEIAASEGKVAVFHRAFDLTPDPLAALESLIKCGVTRVLTSGQASRAYEGIGLIKTLAEQADGRIEILPGAGIRSTNAAHIVEYTGVNQIHFSAHAQQTEPSARAGRSRSISFSSGTYPGDDVVEVISAEKIADVIKSIKYS